MSIDDFVGAPFDREYSMELGSVTQGLNQAEDAQDRLYQLLDNMNSTVESYFDGLPEYVRDQLGPNLSLDDAIYQLDLLKDAIGEAFDALRQADADVEAVKKAVMNADVEIQSAVDFWPKDRDSYYEMDEPAAREMDRYVEENYRA